MNDLLARLRDADTTRRIGESYADTHERRQRDRDEAAAEIERLKKEALFTADTVLPNKDAEIERLRAALDTVRASGLLIGSTTLHDKVRAVVYDAIDAEATAAIDLIRAETLEEAAGVIDENMLCEDVDGTEVLLPRGTSGNKVGVAYAAAIRALKENK